MAIPSRREMRLPLLQHIADGREYLYSELKSALTRHFLLTAADKNAVKPNGVKNKFSARLSTILSTLRAEGLVAFTPSKRDGTYRVTERGRYVLSQSPEALNAAFWRQFKLPSVDAIIPVLLQHVADGKSHHYLALREAVTMHFSITPAQQRAISPSWGLRWNRRWGKARKALIRADFVDNTEAGRYQITALGQEVLHNPPPVIDTAFLATFQLPPGEMGPMLLQHIADTASAPRQVVIDTLVNRLSTDVYPSGAMPWRKDCSWEMTRLERSELVTSTDDGFCEITALGKAALILEPDAFPWLFPQRLRKAAELLSS